MELVNSLTAFSWWPNYLDVAGVKMRGIPEKQGHAFSRHGWLAAQEDPSLDADAVGRALRRQLRPLSAPTLERTRAEYVRREVIPFPRYFIIEPNASCNRKCVFCPIIVTNRKGNLKWPQFLKFIEECGQHEVYGISLYQLSEPMLWRGRDADGNKLDIADMVKASKDIGGFRAVNISTNGDADNLHRLLECDLDDLFISIDGTTAEVYDQNRPSTRANDTGAFQRTIDRVTVFLEAKAKLGSPRPWTRLQIINNELCAPQVHEFIQKWIVVPGVDDVLVKNLDGMTPWLGYSAVDKVEADLKMAKVATMPCQHIYAIGSLTADGRYTACCHDARTELTLEHANVDEMSFAEWWNGPYMTELRAEHEYGAKRLPCRDCAERDPWLGGIAQ